MLHIFQSTVTVREGVDIIQTNISFLRQQFTRMATHILRCTGDHRTIHTNTDPKTTLTPVFKLHDFIPYWGHFYIQFMYIVPFFLIVFYSALFKIMKTICNIFVNNYAVSCVSPDNTFGQCLLFMCTQGLFECLALNLYCLRGEQRALITVINHRIVRFIDSSL